MALRYNHFDLSATLRAIHWLDVPKRIQHKLAVTVHRCLQGKAPQYLIECCTPTSEVAGRQRFRSASRHQLELPRYRRSKFGRRAFSVAGPMAWNSLPDHLLDPTLGSDCFKSRLKTHLFSLYQTRSAWHSVMRFINWLLTYFLTKVCGLIFASPSHWLVTITFHSYKCRMSYNTKCDCCDDDRLCIQPAAAALLVTLFFFIIFLTPAWKSRYLAA